MGWFAISADPGFWVQFMTIWSAFLFFFGNGTGIKCYVQKKTQAGGNNDFFCWRAPDYRIY